MRKMVIWSPIFRIILMLWFTSWLWNLSYFEGLVNNGFATKNYNLENPMVKGKGNIVRRLLVGLETRYPTDPKLPNEDIGIFFKSLLTITILVGFTVLSIIWLFKNFEYLNFIEIRVKFGTLFTDIKPYNKAAREWTTVFCLRRFIIVIATVFMNQFTIVAFFIYSYGSLMVLAFYHERKPFEWKWA